MRTSGDSPRQRSWLTIGGPLFLLAVASGCTVTTSTPTLGPTPTATEGSIVSASPTVAPSTPTAYGSPVSPAVPCVAEDSSRPIPAIALVTSDGIHHPGTPHGTWTGLQVGPAGWGPPTTAIDVASGSTLRVVIDGNVCALDWTIQYGPPPPGGPGPWKFSPTGDLVAPVALNDDAAYAAQNDFTLAPLPIGEWLVAPTLTFSNGEELTWWLVRVR